MQNRNNLLGIIFFLLAQGLMPNIHAQETYPGKIGVGLGLNQWNKPFVNLVRNARAFEALNGDEVAMDAQGWPMSDVRLVVLEAWPEAEWWSETDGQEAHPTDLSGTYTCSFKGKANVSKDYGDFTVSAVSYNESTNTSYFEISIPEHTNGLVRLKFTETQRTLSSPVNSGLRALKIIRPGYDHQTTQVYHDAFLNALTDACFSTIRFMGFSYTNNTNPEYPERTEWGQRKLPNAATFHWTGDNAYPGVPWEYVVDLGNQVKADIWINVPVAASEDYVYQLANLIKNQLDPDLNVYVEYSNEIWNWGFSQAHWNLAHAQSQGLSYIEAYAKRTAEIAQIFGNVFGQTALNDRVRVINCWQIGWWPPNFQYEEQMNYINENFGAPKDLIYGLGVAPSFNCNNQCENSSVAEIIQAMRNASDASVESREMIANVASDWELTGGMLAYEGGSDTGGGATKNVTNRILAERSAEMKEVMIHDLRDNWFSKGGGLFMYQDLADNYSRSDFWGLTDEVDNPNRNYKFAATKAVLGPCNLPETVTVKGTPTFQLFQNHPNPWNSRTTISYSIGQGSQVYLSIYDLTGKEIVNLVNDYKNAGLHKIEVNGKLFHSGVYYYTLKVGDRKESKRFVVIK